MTKIKDLEMAATISNNNDDAEVVCRLFVGQ